MSGGSMDYLYRRIQDAEFELTTLERIAFKELVAEACKAIEWVDSGDVYQAAKRGLVWACHSNKIVPCVATNYNTFPKDAVVITEPEEFTRLTGHLC